MLKVVKKMKKAKQTNAGIFRGSINLQNNRVIIKEEGKMYKEKDLTQQHLDRIGYLIKNREKFGKNGTLARIDEHLIDLKKMHKHGDRLFKENLKVKVREFLQDAPVIASEEAETFLSLVHNLFLHLE